MPETTDHEVSSRILATAGAFYVQARAYADAAGEHIPPAIQRTTACDHESDSTTRQSIYLDDADGMGAYGGVEQCGDCGQERIFAAFPAQALQSGIWNFYHSEWNEALTDSRRALAMAEIIGHILADAYEHARRAGHDRRPGRAH